MKFREGDDAALDDIQDATDCDRDTAQDILDDIKDKVNDDDV